MPDSYQAKTESRSWIWWENDIASFLERDIPRPCINIPARTLRRL
jgi:hypothetical protein